MAAKKDLVPVRILAGFPLEGVTYTPGQLVGFPAAVIEQLQPMGCIDADKEAVAACKAAGIALVEHDPVTEE